jgi:hypothetical protein
VHKKAIVPFASRLPLFPPFLTFLQRLDSILIENMSHQSKDAISAHIERVPVESAGEGPVDLLAHDANVYFDVEEEKRVLRKIDMRVLPLMLGAYFLQQLDKSALSYTSVFNIQKDTNLHGLQYSWLGSVLYLGILVMQPVAALCLVKLPTGKVISTAIFMWGVSLCCMAAAKNFHELLGLRIMLGAFESFIGIIFDISLLVIAANIYIYRSNTGSRYSNVVSSFGTDKQNSCLECNERSHSRGMLYHPHIHSIYLISLGWKSKHLRARSYCHKPSTFVSGNSINHY